MLDTIELTLRGHNELHTVYIDVYDNSLSRKWLGALNDLLRNENHLEKNYCWLGWTETERNVDLLCRNINRSIEHINHSKLSYRISTDPFTPVNVVDDKLGINHERMNQLHRWFEDLQGWSGA